MGKLLSLLLMMQIIAISAFAADTQPPIMNYARQSITFFTPEEKRTKDLKYAYAMISNINNVCVVTIWLRGKDKDIRIIWNSERGSDSPLCTVNINRTEFEKYFDYCVLSEIDVKNSPKDYHVAFGGGPAGGRDKYWFAWRDSHDVSAGFSCIRK